MIFAIALVALLSFMAQAAPTGDTKLLGGGVGPTDEYAQLHQLGLTAFLAFHSIRLRTHHDPSLCVGLPVPGNNTPLGLVLCDDPAADMLVFGDYLTFAARGGVPGQCIDVPDGNGYDGARVQSYQCGFPFKTGSPNQEWRRIAEYGRGDDSVVLGWTPQWNDMSPGWCLAVGGWYYSGADQKVYDGNYRTGEPVVLRPCSADDHNQRWKIEFRPY